MIETKGINVLGTFLVGSASAATAVQPAFYESPEWMGVIAVGGAILLVITIGNGLLTNILIRRKIKWDQKERRNTNTD